ncbi:uncharacterized protein [Mobula birostris]|uniref:uncharacterized protein isoform X3 n=1 Tax=Mobula birostris TaxID=1983395 RepID=UPI003B28CDAF
MDESETYMNFAKTNSGILRKASRDILSSTYSELKTGKEEPLSNKEQDPPVASGRGELPITAQTEGMNSTYSVLNLRKDEPLIHEYEDPPIASGPAELSVTAQADEPEVSYVEINFQRLSEPRPHAADGLTSTYSELNFRRDEPLIEDIEDPPVTSEPGGQPLAARTGADKQEPRENIGDRSYRKICPSCLVTFSVIAIVAGLSIHVLQIRQSLIASDQKYQRLLEEYQEMNRTQRQRRLQNDELNSTLEYRTNENSRLDLSLRTCLKNVSVLESKLLVLESNHSTLENKVLVLESNLSVLSSNLSDQRQMQIHLLDNFRHLEMKYGTLNETKAEICQLLSSRKEEPCFLDWMKIEDSCYFISKFKKSYDEAKEYCSKFNSKLLEINSEEEEDLIDRSDYDRNKLYWIGKCKFGEVSSNVVYEEKAGKFKCRKCQWYNAFYPCSQKQHHFICEKSACWCPDSSEKIQAMCQQPEGPT